MLMIMTDEPNIPRIGKISRGELDEIAEVSYHQIMHSGAQQQAPAPDHEWPAYICDEDNLGDIHDILTAALAGNDLSTLSQRWNQELGIIHSRSLAAHDAAMAAQARKDAIYEVLKDLGFSCPGGEVTPICDLCGANKYCIELRSEVKK